MESRLSFHSRTPRFCRNQSWAGERPPRLPTVSSSREQTLGVPGSVTGGSPPGGAVGIPREQPPWPQAHTVLRLGISPSGLVGSHFAHRGVGSHRLATGMRASLVKPESSTARQTLMMAHWNCGPLKVGRSLLNPETDFAPPPVRVPQSGQLHGHPPAVLTVRRPLLSNPLATTRQGSLFI